MRDAAVEVALEYADETKDDCAEAIPANARRPVNEDLIVACVCNCRATWCVVG